MVRDVAMSTHPLLIISKMVVGLKAHYCECGSYQRSVDAHRGALLPDGVGVIRRKLL